MKKLIPGILIAGIIFTCCGKNPVINQNNAEATTQSASISANATKLAAQFIKSSDGGESIFSSPSLLKKSPALTPAVYTLVDGVLTIPGTVSGEYMKFSYLDQNGQIIKSNVFNDWLNLASQTAAQCHFQAIESGVNANLSITFDAIGDIRGDGSESGTMSVTDNTRPYNCTLTNIRVYQSFPVSGTLALLFDSQANGRWAVSLVYNADGSSNGTITGTDYSATIHINTDGSGTYTDALGTHTI